MLDKLKLAKYCFVLEAVEAMRLPVHKGGTLRGAFGQAFKRMACRQPGSPCDTCPQIDRCAYAYVFETPVAPGSEVLRTQSAVPHPFVFEPPLDGRTEYGAGDELPFGLVLVGRGVDYLPYFILAFKALGEEGLGHGRGRFRLKQIWARDPLGPWETLIYDGPSDALRNVEMAAGTADVGQAAAKLPDDELCLHFLTPTRLKDEGKMVQEPAFPILVRALLRRVSSLYYFHCGERWTTDYKGLVEKAGAVVTVESAVSWQDWERYSGKQQRRIDMGGLVGWVRYAGPLSDFRSLLMLGSVVHVGKGSVFGNGKYEVRDALANGSALHAMAGFAKT
jgi:hypothetical protein